MNAKLRTAVVIASLVGASLATAEVTAAPAFADTELAGSTSDVADAVGIALWMSLDGITLPAPDPACFNARVAGTGPAVQESLPQLVEDPFSLWNLDVEIRRPIIAAFVECADYDDVLFILAANIINSFESAPCIAEAWGVVLPGDVLVSSLSFGGGLDDLLPGVVTALVGGVTFCMPERAWTQWWIDDIAIEIGDRHDVTVGQATCVATNFVQRLGVARAVERRVLTISVLALPDAEFRTIDLAGCGVSITVPPLTPGVAGDCLLSVDAVEQFALVACDADHHREIIALVEVGALMPLWPGHEILFQHAEDSCRSIAEDAIAGRDVSLTLWWWPPTRVAWERGSRSIVCAVGSPENAVWSTPFSVVVPPITVTSTTTSGQKPPIGDPADQALRSSGFQPDRAAGFVPRSTGLAPLAQW